MSARPRSSWRPARLPPAALLIFILLTGCGIGKCFEAYDVGRGETIGSVSSKFDMSPDQLRKINHIESDYELHPGDRIFIPCENYAAKPGKAKNADPPPRPHAPAAQPKKELSRSEAGDKPAAGAFARFAWPLEGEVVRGFTDGRDASGNGLDLKAEPGASMRAGGDGRVEYAGTPANAYGPMVLVSHDGGYYTVYSRLGSISVKKGDKVTMGRVIGSAGSEGYVHFEVRAGRKAVDPLLYLPKR